MSDPIILSDDEENQNAFATPFSTQLKKRRKGLDPTPGEVFIVDDDPTPQKSGPNSAPLFVIETPISSFEKSNVSIVKCTETPRDPNERVPVSDNQKFTGINRSICLESDSETENDHCGTNNWKENTVAYDSSSFRHSESSPPFPGRTDSIGADDISFTSGDRVNHPFSSESYIHQVDNDSDKQNGTLEASNIMQQKAKVKSNTQKLKRRDDATGVKKATKEERLQLMEEKKMKKEQERLQKAALKAETAEIKKMEKEKKKWENGKFALKSIVAEIDTRVVEQGSIGGHLLSRFAEKGLAFRITSNTIEKSIIWSMTVPEEISQLYSKGVEIPYLLLVFEAEEFCNLVVNGSLMDHASRVQNLYPSHTICYLTNRLMAYINKREQEHYKNPNININWKRPPVEEALSKVAVHFLRVHSRQCIDEAEIAEHVAGLTCSLASCQFRKKLTRLSVHANGSVIPKDSVDKNLIKKNLWLKALVAIPKVQPRFALAIWKKYPTMKALLSVYMDPSISVHEKEFLLKDLTTEGLLGSDRRVGEICSKRVYRILMAQCGSIRTDDVEDGADFFSHNTS